MILTQKEIIKRYDELIKEIEPFATAVFQLRLNCLHTRLKTYKTGFQECRDCGKKGIYAPSFYDEYFLPEHRLFKEGKIRKLVIDQTDIGAQYRELKKKMRPFFKEIHQLQKMCKHPNMEWGGSIGDNCPDCGIYIP